MDANTESNEYKELFALLHLLEVLEKLSLVSDRDCIECKMFIMTQLFQLMEGENGY